VLVDERGHIKLNNFEHSMRFDNEVQPMESLSSLAIMPPELIRDHTGGRHTDWWAYGVLAYELLTGEPPFKADKISSNSSSSSSCSSSNSSVNGGNAENMSSNGSVSSAASNDNGEAMKPPKMLSKPAGDFICALLHPDYKLRLGTVLEDPKTGQSSSSDNVSSSSSVGSVTSSGTSSKIKNAVRKAPFFKSVRWNYFKTRSNAAAFVPTVEYCISKSEQLEILREHEEASKSAYSLVVQEASEAAVSKENRSFDGGSPDSMMMMMNLNDEATSLLDQATSFNVVVGSGAAAASAMKKHWGLGYPNASEFLLPCE
jgi:serine/threonine protein kinase